MDNVAISWPLKYFAFPTTCVKHDFRFLGKLKFDHEADKYLKPLREIKFGDGALKIVSTFKQLHKYVYGITHPLLGWVPAQNSMEVTGLIAH